MTEFKTLSAEIRADVGKGASRRLRRQGKVPAVIYGGKQDPVALTISQEQILRAVEHEAFFSSILEVTLEDGRTQQAVIRDLHRHPYRQQVLHLDLLRVSGEEAIRIAVPIHFVGEEESPAGKAAGVVVQHLVTEVEISALPRDLPEFIVADLSQMEPGDAIVLSDLKLPEGVEIPALALEDEFATTVANAIHISADQGTGAAAAAEAEAAAADELGELTAEELEELEAEEGEEGEEGTAEEKEEGTEGDS